MKNKWGNIIGALCVAGLLIIGVTTLGKSAISELAGLAVAQTSTLWNSVADAAKGDSLASGIMAQSPYLWNGVSFDRTKGGIAADASSATGLVSTQLMGLNTAGTNDRIRAGLTADANANTGLLNNGEMVFNGTTWDRLRTASGDALAVTGMIGASNLVWNGASSDRWRSASATNNTATTSLGGAQVTQLSTWSVTNSANAGTPSASKAAGGGTVRHVATSISICVGAAGTAQPVVQVNLRDGATGAGTIIRSWQLAAPANDSACSDLAGLNMSGSANTAMTIEFAAATAAATQASVNLTGYSTP
jgi:hypothetical protein